MKFEPELQNMNTMLRIQLQKYEDFWRNLADLFNADAKVQMCVSRQELSNEYLLAKFGVDTAENGPLKVCQESPKARKK